MIHSTFAVLLLLGMTLLSHAKALHDGGHFTGCLRLSVAGILSLLIAAFLFGRMTG